MSNVTNFVARLAGGTLFIQKEVGEAGAFVLRSIHASEVKFLIAALHTAVITDALAEAATAKVKDVVEKLEFETKTAFYVLVAEAELAAFDAKIIAYLAIEETKYALVKVDNVVVAGYTWSVATLHWLAAQVELDVLLVVHFIQHLPETILFKLAELDEKAIEVLRRTADALEKLPEEVAQGAKRLAAAFRKAFDEDTSA